jgi:hypothetical protein
MKMASADDEAKPADDVKRRAMHHGIEDAI